MQTIIVKTVFILSLLEIMIVALGNAAAVDAAHPTGTVEERPYSGNPMACHQESLLHNDMRCIQNNNNNDNIVSSEPASPSLEERNWSINDEGYSEESRQDCIEATEENGDEEVSASYARKEEPNNSRHQYNAPARDFHAASNTDQDEDSLNEQIHNPSNENETEYRPSPEESTSIHNSSLGEHHQDFTVKDLLMALSLITLMYIFSIILTLGFLGIMGTIEAIRTPNDVAIHNNNSLNFQKDQYAIQIAWLFRWFRSAA